MLKKVAILFIALSSPAFCRAQHVEIRESGGIIKSVLISSHEFVIERPLVSFYPSASEQSPLIVQLTKQKDSYLIKFTNRSKDTVILGDVIPLGRDKGNHNDEGHVFIGSHGNDRLARTHLFLPSRDPVGVIVPDNAWDLGYASLKINDTLSVYALTRRKSETAIHAKLKRFESILSPGGSISFEMHVETFKGSWQEGLRKCFQERLLYDIPSIDETLYNREDLKWIRKAYVMHLMMAWDKDFYDAKTGGFQLKAFLEKGKKYYGGDDVICIWPTWPTLGLDQRNQFDLYRDLPGGLPALRKLADTLRAHGTKFFIAYNPWDESTRTEGHLQGLAHLIKETTADGVVLDTKGESSRELQQAADQVRPGVIMYSEGMAVPKDMPGIISGRVHNALYHPPVLNLNKFIKPNFSIFRVAEVYKEPILREYAVSFFNGYGTEINQFPSGHPDWEDEQYKFLGRTTRILRESSEVFTNGKLTPLIHTTQDGIWVNEWSTRTKTIYTIFSLRQEGYQGGMFKADGDLNKVHWINLWEHVNTKPVNGNLWIKVDPFPESDLGGNNEGRVSCIARFDIVLKTQIHGDTLLISGVHGNKVRVWMGDPSYDKKCIELSADSKLALGKTFGRYEGKIVTQLFDHDELIDETIEYIDPGMPKLVSISNKTKPLSTPSKAMIRIPAGQFTFNATHGDNFIPYPKQSVGERFMMPTMWMDKHPVTNADFKLFMDASGYKPQDTTNFLKHWRDGKIPSGQERFPVVYVSYEDAQHYAAWAGKRLPTEIEWQYAAQTEKMNEWPWKQATPVKRKEEKITETLTVFSLEGIDKRNCNLGDGNLYAVGKYKAGANPFGLEDLVGCVWQLTNDIYESGSYRYIMMKGGSYFKPSSSWWYVQGGPRELHYRQYLLRVSEGFERNATVGFRCVKD